MTNAFALSDGTTVVSFYPEQNMTYPDAKVESVNRTRSGAQYRYVWGHYASIKFDVQYVSSSDMCVVNSWWGANTPLVLYDINSSAVVSGYLVNDTRPIDSYMPPYNDQFGGVIQMESY